MRAERTSVDVFSDVERLISAAAEQVVLAAESAVDLRGRFTVALSGGSTPGPLYELLATPPFADRVDWARTYVFWGDERAVPPDFPESNYAMAERLLLSRVPVPRGNVHRIPGELPAERAADLYEDTLHGFFGSESPDAPPTASFDLMLLGMGDDGHTASLFPGSPAIFEKVRWVVSAQAKAPPPIPRVSLTPIVANASRGVLFLVAGASKARPLYETLEGELDPERLPAQIIQPSHGTLRFMTDAAAARLLEAERTP